MADLRVGEAQSLEGRIQLDTVSVSSAQQFTVTVEGHKFVVNKPVFLAFKNGDPYVIYYLPRSNTMLSAEWLRED
jgi:hypothetical protein